MGDYPDYTDIMQIVGSDIQIPIDIQGAYIMLPVDIQAQYVTLNIDIVAQTVGNITIDIAAQTIGNLAVNLAASAITLDINVKTSAITLNVDITAQTVGNLNFDIKAQSVGIYSYPEWAARAGTDVDPYNGVIVQHNILTDVLDYPVPGGSDLYITQWGINIDSLEALQGRLADYSAPTYDYKAITGGYVGASMVLFKPIKIPGGHHAIIRCWHFAGVGRWCYACLGGYLL